jgi:hypothetical protein
MAKKADATSGGVVYSVHPGVQMMVKWTAELKERTGRSLPEWIEHVKKKGPKTEAERRDWLKKEHGLGTNTAWWIAEQAEGKGDGEDTPEGYLKVAPKYVADMYAGGKAGLKPIHDELVRLGQSLCPELKICPCKTIVPFYRNHVFAQIKPTTKTRIDFGFALGDTKATGRLIDTGGFAKKDRITHRIPITSAAEIDDEVKRWLKKAYEMDAE